MPDKTEDPKVDLVLQSVGTIVASEGGTLELVKLSPQSLWVKYNPGVNKECPECVPTHETVSLFISTSLKIHAPQITEVRVD